MQQSHERIRWPIQDRNGEIETQPAFKRLLAHDPRAQHEHFVHRLTCATARISLRHKLIRKCSLTVSAARTLHDYRACTSSRELWPSCRSIHVRDYLPGGRPLTNMLTGDDATERSLGEDLLLEEFLIVALLRIVV